MSYYEIAYWIGFVLLGANITRITDRDFELSSALIALYLSVGCLGVAICYKNTNYVKTASVPAQVKYADIQDGKLTVLLTDGMVYTYEDYDTIRKWKNGGKFIKNYYFLNSVFGLNLTKEKLELNEN